MHCLWNKHEYQNSADIFVKNIFNPFDDAGLSLYFLKYMRKPEVPDVFRVTEGDQCHEMG